MPEGSYWKNVTKLAGGTAIGQAVAILAAPVLTRLYSPDDFGVLAVYTSIVGIVGALASLSFHRAIPLPEDDNEAANVFGLSLVSTFLVVVLVSIAVGLLGEGIALRLGVPELASFLWLIPLGVLGLALYETVNQWAIRQKTFSVIAGTTVAKGIVQTGTHLVAGFIVAGPVGLLSGQLLGQWTGVGSLLRNAIAASGTVFRDITGAGMREAAIRYRKFLQFTSPSVILNVAGRDTPPLILSYFFGGAVAGLFALGERVVMIPVTLVAKNASQVFVASAAEYHKDGRLSSEVENLFERMFKLGLAPVLILGISAPVLFAFVFGDQWGEAGHYVRWLSGWLLFVFVSYAMTPVILVLERQRAGMFFEGLLAVGRVGSLIAGGVIGNALLAIALFGVVSGLLWAIYLAWMLNVSRVSMGSAARVIGRTLVWSTPFVLPVIGCIIFSVSDIVTIGVALSCILFATLRTLAGLDIRLW